MTEAATDPAVADLFRPRDPDAPVDVRVLYSTGVYGQEEIDAVVNLLESGYGALQIGPQVARMEQRVSALFGKASGVMVNSGSSGLFLAVELLGLPPGSEVITPPITFSTDLSSLIRAGLVPTFVDVEPDTFVIDANAIEAMIGPKTKAMLIPNLAGNAPDWDAIRITADAHGLKLIEDSCDCIGPTLRGIPTGHRSDLTVTSFSLSHVITCAGTGGMVMLDDPELRDKALSLRRWGRRSERQIFGTKKGQRSFWEDLDGLHYDSMFIFDDVAWNFEPSELGAAFGNAQLNKLAANIATRQRNFDRFTEFLSDYREYFTLPRANPDLETGWMCYPFLINGDAPFERADLQSYLENRGIDTRTVWTGNAVRQPMMRNVALRQPDGGLPNADNVMSNGMMLSVNHGLSLDLIDYVCGHVREFIQTL